MNTIVKVFFIQFFLWYLVMCASPVNKNRYGAFVKGIECYSDVDVTADRVCIYRPMRNILGKFSMGGTLLYPVTDAFLKLQVFIKSSSNVYHPSIINLDLNVCQIVSSNASVEANKQVITTFWPEFLEKLGHLIHPCPYEGRVEIADVIVDRLLVPSFLSTGDVKVLLRLYNSQNRTLFEVTILLYIRGKSLLPQY